MLDHQLKRLNPKLAKKRKARIAEWERRQRRAAELKAIKERIAESRKDTGT